MEFKTTFNFHLTSQVFWISHNYGVSSTLKSPIKKIKIHAAWFFESHFQTLILQETTSVQNYLWVCRKSWNGPKIDSQAQYLGEKKWQFPDLTIPAYVCSFLTQTQRLYIDCISPEVACLLLTRETKNPILIQSILHKNIFSKLLDSVFGNLIRFHQASPVSVFRRLQ